MYLSSGAKTKNIASLQKYVKQETGHHTAPFRARGPDF